MSTTPGQHSRKRESKIRIGEVTFWLPTDIHKELIEMQLRRRYPSAVDALWHAADLGLIVAKRMDEVADAIGNRTTQDDTDAS